MKSSSPAYASKVPSEPSRKRARHTEPSKTITITTIEILIAASISRTMDAGG
jgi:hypothetical protein